MSSSEGAGVRATHRADQETDGQNTSYGTDLLRTFIRVVPGGHEWTRTTGPLAPAAFQPITGLEARLAAVGRNGTAHLATSTERGQARVYAVVGEESVAGRLLSDGPLPRLQEPIRGLGAALHQLHADGPPPATERLGPPRGLVRLRTWLTGRSPIARAAYVGAQMQHHLGSERWAQVTDWCRNIVDETDVTLVHGAPGLGSLVDGVGSSSSALLTGEDLSVAPWQYDVGWVLGELVELKWHLGGDQQDWQLLVDALFEGYGQDLGTRWNRAAALRTLLHVHDIAAYVGWHPSAFNHYGSFLRFLIDI